MLAAQIDAVLDDFTRRRIPFSHRDVADHIPNLAACQLDEVRRLVLERMSRVPTYRLNVAHFVGEGPALVCVPCDLTPTPDPSPSPIFLGWERGEGGEGYTSLS
jgi:hypothetical protein